MPTDFASSNFMPHGFCLSWNPELLWLLVIGNTLVAFSYFSIPAALIFMIRKRKDIPFNWMFVLFATFITACGVTHLAKIWTLWHPDYWLEGGLDALTGIISAYTAVVLWMLVPRITPISKASVPSKEFEDKPSFFQNKFAFGLAISLIGLFALLFLSIDTSMKLLNMRRWADHSNQVLQQMETTLSSVKDIETGYRGFVITGSTDFLAPYYNAVTQSKDDFRRLQNMTIDNETIQNYINELKPLVQEKISFADKVVHIRENEGHDKAKDLINQQEGLQLMKTIRSKFETMKEHEVSLLTKRYKKAEADIRSTTLFLISLSLLILLIFVGLFVGLHRSYSQRETALKRLAGLQRGISAIKDYAILLLDTEGRVLTWNKGAEAMKGYTPQEIIGASFTNFYTQEDLDSSKPQRLLEIATNIGRAEDEGLRVRSDGTTFIADVVITALRDEAGRLVGFVKVSRDITERRQAEEMAKKNNELELILQIASHDLKEPLRSIQSFSYMVQERYAERLDADGQDFLMRVIDSASHLDKLLDDLLSMSRARRIATPAEEVDLASVVNRAMKNLEQKIKKTEAKVTIAKSFPTVKADSTWAVQAVYNLIVNALKFTSENEVPDIEIVPYLTDTQAGVTIRDRGPGVKAEYANRIFQLFQRAVGRNVEGTGAGLAIVQQIAEKHGGRAWVQPRAGGGSEFTVTFGPPSHISASITL